MPTRRCRNLADKAIRDLPRVERLEVDDLLVVGDASNGYNAHATTGAIMRILVKEQALEAVAEIESKVSKAQASAEQAKSSETSAKQSAQNAAASAGQSATSAQESGESAESAASSADTASENSALSKSWAIGGTGVRPGEDANNAKYWAEQANAAAGGGVSSFNGRTGFVVPQTGDYTPEMVGSIPKVTGAVSGNIPSLNDAGGVDDSGIPVSGIGKNLLINPGLSINQRGNTLYPSKAGYMFDGFLRGNPGTAELIGGAWKLTQGTAKGFIMCQRLESLPDGKYTASIRVAAVSGNWTLYFIAGKKDVKITAPGVYSVTGDVSDYSNTNYAVVLYSDSIGDTITFPNDGGSIIKLEHGDRQTLAITHDGVMSPLEYPDYQVELVRCKRLFNKMLPNAYLATSSLAGLYELMVQFPSMRKSPNVTLIGSQTGGELNIRAELVSKSTCLIRSNTTGSYVSAIELTAEL